MRRVALLVTLVVLAVAGALLALRPPSGAPHDVPTIPTPPGTDGPAVADPYAYEPSRDAEFASRAAAGEAHLLYALSPGGAEASAARTARWRPLIESAARTAGVDPDTLEGLVFLESAGRPDAVTPAGLKGAVGLTQILAETAQNLLGMHVDLAASRKLTKRIVRESRRGHKRKAAGLERRRRQADQRFDPQAELAGTARYLALARKHFGREDLAFVSYHMGIGNLDGVLRAYGAGNIDYTQVYFDSTPTRHAAAFQKLFSLGDDSANYLWKLAAARRIMSLWRTNRTALQAQVALQTAKNSAEEVLHPSAVTPQFADPGQLRTAWQDHDIVAFANDPARTGLARDRAMGELAKRVGASADLYRGLRPEALATALYIGAQVRAISGTSPLTVTSTVRDATYQRVLAADNIEATHRYSLHTTGWAFDISRHYRSRRQALAFQFVLDRLQALNVIAWLREPEAIHVTAGPDAKRLLPLLKNP